MALQLSLIDFFAKFNAVGFFILEPLSVGICRNVDVSRRTTRLAKALTSLGDFYLPCQVMVGSSRLRVRADELLQEDGAERFLDRRELHLYIEILVP